MPVLINVLLYESIFCEHCGLYWKKKKKMSINCQCMLPDKYILTHEEYCHFAHCPALYLGLTLKSNHHAHLVSLQPSDRAVISSKGFDLFSRLSTMLNSSRINTKCGLLQLWICKVDLFLLTKLINWRSAWTGLMWPYKKKKRICNGWYLVQKL